MSKEKQIEEIDELTTVLYEANHKKSVLDYHWLATEAYKAGYRKQSENTVEVVRCKDCEYWTEVSFDAITEWHWGECKKPLGDYRDCDTAEHDFCSYGEAKEMKGGAE